MFRVDGSSFSSELLTLHSEISVEIDGTANSTNLIQFHIVFTKVTDG